MTRLIYSLLALFLCFAISSSALPTSTGVPQPTSTTLSDKAAAELALSVLKAATEMMGHEAGTGGNTHGIEEAHSPAKSFEDKKPEMKASPTQTSGQTASTTTLTSSTSTATKAHNNNLLSGLGFLGSLLGGSAKH
ncbi:hypothetical protein PHISCL_06444 [Aspergillus sclerotialis]|uniref:Uncharacterized protein n=1 Tax=Aspergillus sclerotialis TaxID=2070753 RepID=A0A3A2ZW31_9EURO|nr:hypothetical protein PHISCL_06444 [Aspergillus sclerotialis]